MKGFACLALLVLLAIAAGAACSSSRVGSPGAASGDAGDGPTPKGCKQDSTLSCAGGAGGYACAPGDNPENYEGALVCGNPTSTGVEDDFCCADQGGPLACAPNSGTQCPSGSYGFTCAPGQDPTTENPVWVCGSPMSDGENADFCCTVLGGDGGVVVPPNCSNDSTISCTGGAFGFACPAGYTPENYDSYVCSEPTPNGSQDDYCCFPGDDWSATTCQPNDTWTIGGCPGDGSYGFICAAGDDPTTYDSTLVCGAPAPDGSNVDYCCTYP